MTDSGQHLIELADSFDAATPADRAAFLADFLGRLATHQIDISDCPGSLAAAIVARDASAAAAAVSAAAKATATTLVATRTATKTGLEGDKQDLIDLIADYVPPTGPPPATATEQAEWAAVRAVLIAYSLPIPT